MKAADGPESPRPERARDVERARYWFDCTPTSAISRNYLAAEPRRAPAH